MPAFAREMSKHIFILSDAMEWLKKELESLATI